MTTLAHAEYGDGPPVVVLHGLFGSARNWAGIAKRLAARRRVLTLDLPNHGDSPWSAAMDYASMADAVRAFITERGLEAPAVLGHSMGGKVAMALALSHAGAVGSLIVVDVAPIAHATTMMAYVEAMRGLDLAGKEPRAEVDADLAATVADARVRAFLLHNLVAHGDGLRWRLNLDAIAAGMEAISGFPEFADGTQYAGRALFVTGAESGSVRPEHEAAIGARFPRAEMIEIAGTGHWVHADRPDAFTEAVAGFLDSP